MVCAHSLDAGISSAIEQKDLWSDCAESETLPLTEEAHLEQQYELHRCLQKSSIPANGRTVFTPFSLYLRQKELSTCLRKHQRRKAVVAARTE